MADSFVARITPLESGGSPDQGLPGNPGYPGHPLPPFPGYPGHPLPPGGIALPPIALPPFPGLWPPPGQPTLPIVIPPGNVAMPPIFIPEDPTKPPALPPGTIWPPIPPDTGITGKVIILVWIIGVGYRWYVYDAAAVTPPIQPTPGPK